MVTRRKRRELRCPCGGPLRVTRTAYADNSITRYRRCADCRAPFKTIEKVVGTGFARALARTVRRVLLHETNEEEK